MSRTYKDVPYKVRDPESDWDYRYDNIPYIRTYIDWRTKEEKETQGVWFRKKRGVLTKKKKHVDTENHWISTPGWWVRCMMNRPQRVASKQWEKDVVRMSFWDIAQDNFDPPMIGRKPHIYYH